MTKEGVMKRGWVWWIGLFGPVCNFFGGLFMLWYSRSWIWLGPSGHLTVEVSGIENWKSYVGISLIIFGFFLQIIAHIFRPVANPPPPAISLSELC